MAMKQADWIGQKVKLLREIRTKGRTLFPEGEIMRVGSAYRGRLNLYDLTGLRQPDGGLRCVRKVAFADVRLIGQ